SLALTMSVALLTSLVLALSFTPVLAEKFVKARPRAEDEALAEASEEENHGRFLSAIVRRYEWLLGKALDSRMLVFALCFGVLIGSYVIYRNLGSGFLPDFDEGAFVLDYFTPAGTSLAETNRVLKHVEQMLAETPEVESYSRRTGLQLGLSITEPNTGDF